MFSSKSSDKRRDNLHRADSTRSNDSAEMTYSADVIDMLQNIPTDELDLVHFVIGHGILRRDMRCVGWGWRGGG